MSYSLGDNKESVDIYINTINFLDIVGKKMMDNGWCKNEKTGYLSKDNRKIKFETDQDHITSIYIYDFLVDWDKFCENKDEYEKIYENDEVACVSMYVSKNSNINKMIRDLENAPLKEIVAECETITKIEDLDEKHSFTVARIINNTNCVELHYFKGEATVEYGEKISDSEWENTIQDVDWFNKNMTDEEVLDKLEMLFTEYENNEYCI